MADDAKAFGLEEEAEALKPKPFPVWPENVLVMQIFDDMRGHWVERQTQEGRLPLALDRLQLKCALELMGVKRREWPALFNDIKVMEDAALEALAEDFRD